MKASPTSAGVSGQGVSWVFAGITPSRLLVGEDLLAQLLPTHVELALELVDPFLLRLMRRMGAAGHVVDEERLVGRGRVQAVHVVDGVVRHIGDEVVAGLPIHGKTWVVLLKR